jgi:hypothetical protein
LVGCDKKVSEEGRAQILRAANTVADASREWKKHGAELIANKADDAELFAGAVSDMSSALNDRAELFGSLINGFSARAKINDATIAKLKADVKASQALPKRFAWIAKRMHLKSGDEVEFAAWKSTIQNSLEAHAKAVELAWAEVEKVLPKKEVKP